MYTGTSKKFIYKNHLFFLHRFEELVQNNILQYTIQRDSHYVHRTWTTQYTKCTQFMALTNALHRLVGFIIIAQKIAHMERSQRVRHILKWILSTISERYQNQYRDRLTRMYTKLQQQYNNNYKEREKTKQNNQPTKTKTKQNWKKKKRKR